MAEQYASAMVLHHPLECLLLTFFLSAYFPTNYAQLQDNTQPEVTIPQGTLLGITLTTRNSRNISGFLGIPYGKPPTGNLRFANPVAADGWNETLNATVDPSMCSQIATGVLLGQEDCLYLNVYTPQLPQTANPSLLPVMVYIHGGGFQYGSQTSTEVGPEYLLDKDVLFVAMNYRLSALGFLSTGDEAASGNWGLKDQILALEWVQDNIHYFGGDPDQVTLFGESAGACAVHLLTLSNATIGLFHRYITESGSALATWAHRPRVTYGKLAFELGEYVGCFNNTSDSLISCLRTVDVSNIMAAVLRFLVWETFPDVVWGPTDEPNIEGAILTDSPSDLFDAGEIRDLPWMSGVVRDEGLIFTAGMYKDEEQLNYFLENIDYLLPIMLFWTYQSDSGAAWVNATKSYYFNNDLSSNTNELLSKLTLLIGDSHFFYPAHNALEQQHALAVNPQYFYTFNYRGTFSQTDIHGGLANYGVSHADDLLYLFPGESLLANLNGTMSETDYEMVDRVVDLWTSFAINGTPTSSALSGTRWEPYSAEDNYLRIGNESDTDLEMQYVFFEERMQFWASLYANVEAEASVSDDSGAVNSSPNLFFLLLVTSLKYTLSAARADSFG